MKRYMVKVLGSDNQTRCFYLHCESSDRAREIAGEVLKLGGEVLCIRHAPESGGVNNNVLRVGG